MEIEEEDPGEELFRVERDQQAWYFLFILLAASLWAQWLGLGAWTEIQSEDGSAAILALHLLPLGTAAVAVMWNHPAPRLVIFPVSFLPGLALLAEAEWASLAEGGSVLLALVTFGLYLVVAAGRPGVETLEALPSRRLEPEVVDGYAWRFKRFVTIRMTVMAVLFLVITYALFFDPAITATLSEIEVGEQTHHVFMVVLLYFSWMIVVYMGAILPILNWEHDRRQPAIPRRQRELMANPGRLGRRIVFWILLLFTAMSTSMWMMAI